MISPPLIIIGASAGGPTALATILCQLPADFAAAIIIIQHVNARFAEDMAVWLNSQCTIPVRIAREGDTPVPGTALLAGTDDHLVFHGGTTLGYIHEPSEALHRPSINVFFDSVSTRWHGGVVGVLLTGMGSDGARGLLRLRQCGATTIVQDRESSVVYGMPKAAIELDAATEILPITMIGPRLVALARETIHPLQRSSHA